MSGFPVTIFHNPACGTSRAVLALIRAAGHEPTVVPYLKTGWTRPQLEALLARMGAAPRDLLRTRGTPAAEFGLLGGCEVADLAWRGAFRAVRVFVAQGAVDRASGTFDDLFLKFGISQHGASGGQHDEEFPSDGEWMNAHG